jgi:hypothetical protein
LQGAAIEEEEELHTKWSALLANAASSDKVHPSYIEILKQLTPDDARLLDRLYEHTTARGKWLNNFLEEEGDEDGIPFQNLVRLGLIESTYDVDGMEVSVRPGHTPYVSGEMDQNRWLTDFALSNAHRLRRQIRPQPTSSRYRGHLVPW